MPAKVESTAGIKKKLFDVEEYYRMAETGILPEDARVELIEGEILETAPMGARHANVMRRLEGLLHRLVGQNGLVNTRCPVRLDDRTEPEPDFMVLKPRKDFYPEHPRPTDVLVAVEVADSSVGRDKRWKLPLYADSGIPETWLVDLPGETVEVHSRPATGGYRETLRAKRGETVEPKTVPGLRLAVDDVLG